MFNYYFYSGEQHVFLHYIKNTTTIIKDMIFLNIKQYLDIRRNSDKGNNS